MWTLSRLPRARIAMAYENADGRKYALAVRADKFDRRECQKTLRQWALI